jgi:hypothetical protein
MRGSDVSGEREKLTRRAAKAVLDVVESADAGR